MCEPATIGLIISAVSGGVTAKNNADAFKRKDQQTALGIQKNAKEQTDANARVNEQISDIDGNTGQSEQAEVLGEFQNALRAGQDQTNASQQDVAGANDRFSERVGAGTEAVAAEGSAQAERLATVDGILRQRINEGTDIGRTGQDINAIQNNINAEDFLTQLRVAGERPNTGVGIAAGIGSGIGAGMSQMGPTKVNAAGPAIVGQGGTGIGSAGAVNPFGGGNRSNPTFLMPKG